MDNVTSSLNLSVNVHEVHDIPQLAWTSILTGIVLYTIVLVTIFGNILVLVAVFVNKNLQTTFNYYVVNLAITDFAVAVTAMSFHTLNYSLLVNGSDLTVVRCLVSLCSKNNKCELLKGR